MDMDISLEPGDEMTLKITAKRPKPPNPHKPVDPPVEPPPVEPVPVDPPVVPTPVEPTPVEPEPVPVPVEPTPVEPPPPVAPVDPVVPAVPVEPPVVPSRVTNEPVGLTLVEELVCNMPLPYNTDPTVHHTDDPIAGSNWRCIYNEAPESRLGGWATSVVDPTAPHGPAVFDFVYPEGMPKGTAPATLYRYLYSREAYVAFWWKVSDPHFLDMGQKIAFMMHQGEDGGTEQNFMCLRPGYVLSVMCEVNGPVYGWRPANVKETPVTIGKWHFVEWYQNLETGVLKYWLDGELQGHHTDITVTTRSMFMFQLSPTWGGNGGTPKAFRDHYYYDCVRICAR